MLLATLCGALAVAVSPAGPALWSGAALATAAGLGLGAGADGRLPPGRDALRLAELALFALALNAAFTHGAPLVALGRSWPVSREGVRVGVETAVRLVALLVLFRGAARAISALAALAHVERALAPWARARRGVGELLVVLLVALRLAPGLGAEARRLTVQRALRGDWPGPGAPARERRRRLALGLRQLPAVLVPLALLVLRRAEELAWALPARYYGLGVRTPPRPPRWRAREWAAVAAGVALLGWAAWARSRA